MARFLYRLFITIINFLLSAIPLSCLRVGLLRICGAKIGSRVYIASDVRVEFPWKLNIGMNCYISRNVLLDCRGGSIFLGINTDISEGAKVYTLTHDINSVNFSVVMRDVVIGSRVWICTMAIVLPGSVIDDGCVLGASSVYSGISSANSLYMGNRARLIKALPENRSSNVRC